MDIRDIKTKRPWRRMTPEGYMSQVMSPSPDEGVSKCLTATQADFLRELHPSGHKINSELFYPNIYRYEVVPVTDENGEPTGETKTNRYVEYVPRFAFAFQQVIKTKQMIHLCGNDIQFELNSDNPTKEDEEGVEKFREGWLQKDMEYAFANLAESVKCTGDGAVVFYFDNERKVGVRNLSYLRGDKLYPHYDHDGKLSVFARFYNDYDDQGATVTEWLEVWDSKNYSVFKRNVGGIHDVVNTILDVFQISGYTKVKSTPHGFNGIPVAYMRDENGPCWSAAQDSIEAYELSFSQMAHNNEAYGEPILVLQGDDVDAEHDMSGSVKRLSMDTDSKASYLQAQSASESYMKQIETLYKMIFTQAFIVEPPELKSGDLPAAALKILYSPAVEKAMEDAVAYQPVLNDMVRIFAFGLGVEMEATIRMTNLPMKWWIKPYVHVSESAVIADLVQGVNAGFISKQTASERASFYTTTGEIERCNREHKDEQAADLLYEIKASRAAAQNKQQEAEE